ncbi:hypothetical protein ASPACDRAFT_1853881 [Aspergillus aculeatus ATCC 16872]|uniref:Uncharacterized protein n=1 Tax=Aspergillus aculeatus (strain ATCC 16872 / CBS 172.66 / WB 5094) TaxID=690307 RepID=A0A1L9X050_ASPA1|nr:uncharacterized protein ASPACDRAFT_1853881 [Aspergillus aculeatus ATCC 16872]OJK01831.1 hypothetical protein ASPACDRAFT_1853881 [Aspergillus aculeatus ATCC 16872]
MYFHFLALLGANNILTALADTTHLATRVVRTVTTTEAVTGTDIVVGVTKFVPSETSSTPPLESATSTVDSINLTRCLSVLETAVPTSWWGRMRTDPAFFSSEILAEKSGSMPSWYSNLPTGARAVLSSEEAIYASLLSSESALATGWDPSSTAGSPSASSATSTSSPTQSKTSISTGGAAVATGSWAMGIASVGGILGLALAL